MINESQELADAVLQFAELQGISGLERPTAVARWLQRIGVVYTYDAANRPITTVSAFGRTLARKRRTKACRSSHTHDDGFNLNALG